jgi:Holliday junction resolvase RusA-like endonuclease
MIELRVEGKPTGKGRPQFSRHGDNVHVRTPAATIAAEGRVQLAWIDAGRPRLPDGPVRIGIVVTVARPKAHWKTDGTLTAAGARSVVPTSRPDIDNILKLVGDALNGHAYHDDALIYYAHIERRWANQDDHEHMIVMLDVLEVPKEAAA